MKPPYYISPKILTLISSIAEKLGEINATSLQLPKAELRKNNQIKTIQSSLAIEGNTLSIEQVTAILHNKKVIGPKKDILEVENAIRVYQQLESYKANSLPSFLKAHDQLLKGLIPSAGKIRGGNVAIVKGAKMTHMAPSPQMVKALLNDLFTYLKKDPDPMLIKSCVFHYELEFIHPFTDGNGRMGRLWQTVLLKEQYPVFAFLPVETIIKKRQKEYYAALSASDKAGNSTLFIEFMLGILDASLEELLSMQHPLLSATDRINLFLHQIGQQPFTRKDYLRFFKEISPATASRDLRDGVETGLLHKRGDKRMTVYQFFDQQALSKK